MLDKNKGDAGGFGALNFFSIHLNYNIQIPNIKSSNPLILMSLLEKFRNHIDTQFSFLSKKKLLIAISGGIDSVVLTYLCHQLKLNITLAHCNFNLRGDESDADEQYVLDLGEHLNLEAFVQNFDTKAYAKQYRRSIQMSARELRYTWFQDLVEQLQFDYILTAHHADDNLETFLINFTRGTGLNGLTSIPPVNGNIVRPLLPFSRLEVEDYAKKHQIIWCEDSSNSSRKYLRNKLRHEVVPVLKAINPQLLDSFKNTLNHLNGISDIISDTINVFKKKSIVKETDEDIIYKISEFKTLSNPQIYLYHVFHDFGFTEWSNVLNLLEADTGKYVSSSTHRLTRHREYLILSDINSKTVKTSIHITHVNESIQTPLGLLNIENVLQPKNNTNHTIYVDKSAIQFPLKLRLWQTGDMFQPMGMQGKKKVSKFLKDQKLTPNEKENTWVLTSNSDIVWVVGLRADERFKIIGETEEILKIEIA